MKKALVFGAGGFAGGHLVNELVSNNYEVYGCSRYGKITDKRYAGAMVCDIMDVDRVKTVIAEVNPDYIINMAGISSVGLSWKIPQTTIDVNVVGPVNILETVKETNPDAHILFIGSSEEYAPKAEPISEVDRLDANNPYGISKVMLERLVSLYRDHYGMHVHYVRAFNHTGIGQADTFVVPSWCKQVAEISVSGKPGTIRVGNLNVARDFSDVRDVVRAYRMVLESDDCSQIYNICSGKAIYLEKILEFITSMSEQPVEIEVNQKLIRPVENDTIFGDHSKITKDLGWEPEIDLKDTIREMYEDFVSRKRS
ncbi:GDPmannose 4,6-dehydratase [Butyrivibrio proteoclasticus]|uniref:GDPmannose 4,6-dehydratase n=1 Tax=Butyrivibrio proteoclasticus TaxID=43305 RepID=A0A1I5PTE5_9FIRM|nr:GDP-mannose 4,6-dehydratase [Butyrivibrio proteoclasticus]SFP37315.1 GDPmannose 4,6-dehydratase [Butyrivibrio proteoclasticus]